MFQVYASHASKLYTWNFQVGYLKVLEVELAYDF